MEFAEGEFGELFLFKLSENFGGSFRENGFEEDREVGAGLGGVGEDFSDAREFTFVLFHFPRLVALEVAVAVGDVGVDGEEGFGYFAGVHRFLVGGGGVRKGLAEGGIALVIGVGVTDGGVAKALGHVDGPVEEVAEVVGELGVKKHDEAGEVEVAVLSGADVTAEVVAESFRPELIGEFVGIDDVADGFGHFIAFHVPESVDEEGGHLLGLEAHGVEHAGPVDGVRGDEDVFSDDLEIGGPKGVEVGEVGAHGLLVSGEGDVVDKSVEPDVGHEIGIEGEGDTPGHAVLRAGDAEIGFAGAFNGVEDFLLPEFGNDFEVIVFDGALQPLGVVGEFEIPVLLFDFDDFAPFGTEVAFFIAVAVGKELLLTDRIVAGVGFFVELALGFELGEDGLDAGLVPVVGRFGPAIEFQSELFPELEEALGISRGEGGDVDALGLGRFHHLLPMLIDSGEVVSFFALEAGVSGENIGKDLLVGMTNMGFTVGVVDGGSDEFHREKTRILIARLSLPWRGFWRWL